MEKRRKKQRNQRDKKNKNQKNKITKKRRNKNTPAGKPTATTVPFLLLTSTAVLKARGEVAKQATAWEPPLVYLTT